MNLQQILSLGIVAITAILLVRSYVRKKNRSAFGFCEDECGCSTSDLVKKIPADRLRELKEQQRHRASMNENKS
jgi:hypothetical protein